MKPTFAGAVTLGIFALAGMVFAQADDAPAFVDQKQSTTVMEVTTYNRVVETTVYRDGSKLRVDSDFHGVHGAMIILMDEQKVYDVMDERKVVMVVPFRPEMASHAILIGDKTGWTELGPNTMNGVATIKWSHQGNGRTMLFWVNAAGEPVQVTADDGSLSATVKSYTVGPIDSSLFVPPSDYAVTDISKIGTPKKLQQ